MPRKPSSHEARKGPMAAFYGEIKKGHRKGFLVAASAMDCSRSIGRTVWKNNGQIEAIVSQASWDVKLCTLPQCTCRLGAGDWEGRVHHACPRLRGRVSLWGRRTVGLCRSIGQGVIGLVFQGRRRHSSRIDVSPTWISSGSPASNSKVAPSGVTRTPIVRPWYLALKA